MTGNVNYHDQIVQSLDVTGAEEVEVSIKSDGSVIWINVDGLLRLRVCRIKKITIEDGRK